MERCCSRCGLNELPLVPSTCIQCHKPLCASCTVSFTPQQCWSCAQNNAAQCTFWLLSAFADCNPTKCHHCLQWNLQYKCVGCAAFQIEAHSLPCDTCYVDDTPHLPCVACREMVCMKCLGPNMEPQCPDCFRYSACMLCERYMPWHRMEGLCVFDMYEVRACWWCTEAWIVFALHARRILGRDVTHLILDHLLR